MVTKISVIIPCLNMISLTKDTITGLARTCDVTFELIVINNGSTDETREWLTNVAEPVLKQNPNFIRLINVHNPENRFWSTACNQGAKIATGEFITFLANDILVPPKFFSWAIDQLIKNPKIGAISPFYTEDRAFAGVDNYYNNYSNIPKKDEWTPGWHMAPFQIMHREVFESVGEWDEAMRTHMMDNDWGIRLEMLGYQPTTWKGIVCYHAYGSFGRKSVKLEKKIAKNDMRFFIKKWKKDVAQPNDVIPSCIINIAAKGNYISNKQKRQGFKWKKVEIINSL